MTTNSSWKAFSLGLRWGCGHSIGLIIMALIFFAAGQTINLNDVGVYCNYVVGVFMVALGGWTAHHVRRKYQVQRKEALIAASTASGECLLPTRATSSERVPSSVTPLASLQRTSSQSSRADDQIKEPDTPTAAFQVLVTVDSTGGGDNRREVRLSDGAASAQPEDSRSEKEETEQTHRRWLCKSCKPCKSASFSNPTTQRVRQLSLFAVGGVRADD